MVLRLLHSRALRAELGWRQALHGLPQRGGLEQPAHFEMLAQPVDCKRAGVPALVRVLFDQPGALESSQHLMGDGPADDEMLGERALVDKEPTVRQQGCDGMLDQRIDARLVIERLEAARHRLGQAQARVHELSAHDRSRVRVRRRDSPAPRTS